jgi:hypothetical protein
MLSFDQFVDQAGGGSEAHTALLTAGGHEQRREQVRFSRTAVADQ